MPDFDAFARRIQAIHPKVVEEWERDETLRFDSWLGYSWVTDNPVLVKAATEEVKMCTYLFKDCLLVALRKQIWC